MDNNYVFTAVIVSAGNGIRMHSHVKKQYIPLCGESMIIHTIRAFELNPLIDHIVVVSPRDETEKVLEMCISKGFKKICSVTEGGKERYDSVYNGILQVPGDTNYVLIHDGVRPLVSQDLINRCCKSVQLANACIAAVPVNDTIKKATGRRYVSETLRRDDLWAIQTPQAFFFPLIQDAYKELYKTLQEYGSVNASITDDSIVVENMTGTKVKIVLGDYRNIKVTTPSDLIVAEAFFNNPRKG